MQSTLPLVFLPVDSRPEVRDEMGPVGGSGTAAGASDEGAIGHRTANFDQVRATIRAAENRPLFSEKHGVLQRRNSKELRELETGGTTST